MRSTELTQHEVAYYFSALALGLIGGLGVEPMWLSLSLMALILGVMFIVDHPGVLRSYRAQNVVLDQAIADPAALKARLEEILGGTVHTVIVQCLDLVNDKTTVDVRFEAGTGRKTLQAPRGPLQEQLPAVERDSLNQVRAS